MRSPKDMEIIEIDITNACVNKCSNCTRFCGHHKKTFFMDFETFKKAVDSMEGFEGCVGLIGGEPTLHPEFEKFADYIREKRLHYMVKNSRKPIGDMVEHMNRYLRDFGNSKTVLWSSLSKSYYKHFETINQSFEAQGLNDHNNTCMHQGLLMARKDLGISDEEWIKKRDACWLQNTWSATITPKGTFFCEMAGGLDMLFDGPGGWPIEKGWWKRDVSEFKDQLHWCELCSACLDVPQRISNDGRDDITPTLLEKLKKVDSPKVKHGDYILWDKNNYDKTKYQTFIDADDYMSKSFGRRTSSENRNIYPKSFDYTTEANLAKTLQAQPKDWVVVCDNENNANEVIEDLKDFIINPGCVYLYKDVALFNVLARSIREKLDKLSSVKELVDSYPESKVIKLKKLPSLLKEFPQEYLELKAKTESFAEMSNYISKSTEGKKVFIYDNANMYEKIRPLFDGINETKDIKEASAIFISSRNYFSAQKEIEKKYNIDLKKYGFYNIFGDAMQEESYHYSVLEENNVGIQLKEMKEKYAGKKCVIYGAGILFDVLRIYYGFDGFNIVGISDRKFCEKDCKEVAGFECIKPNDLSKKDFDVLIVTTVSLKKKLEKLKADLNLPAKVEVVFCYQELEQEEGED